MISPTGARALFVARGDVFSAPAKEREVRNITQTPGVRPYFTTDYPMNLL